MSPINLTDSYKLDHRRQYPEGTEFVYSNWTPRMTRVEGVDSVVFFGLQYFLEKYLNQEFGAKFFERPVEEVTSKYARRVNAYLGPNDVGTDHMAELHALGYLPLRFSALPEGTRTPLRVPMLTVENTDARFGWLVNYIETLMSSVLWQPCTSATTAMRKRDLLDKFADLTGSPKDFVGFQGHDFSFRGMCGPEAAAISGAGHLVFFEGTDTIPAVDLIEDYYGGNVEEELIGVSVPATEHSVMCAGGEDDEFETYSRLLDLYPAGILSVVSDTWDFWAVLTEILPQLKDRIMAREGRLVVRPDSGDPTKIIAGDPDAPAGSPANKGTVEVLWDLFGGTVTDEGFKLLDTHIGVIYGDSINYERATAILNALHDKGFASGNVVFGMGSYTYQYVTRDTYGFAMKATWVQINGKGIDIFKDPKTDSGFKKSAIGRLAVLTDEAGTLYAVNRATPEQEAASLLQPVWENGHFLRTQDFANIRAIARLTA